MDGQGRARIVGAGRLVAEARHGGRAQFEIAFRPFHQTSLQGAGLQIHRQFARRHGVDGAKPLVDFVDAGIVEVAQHLHGLDRFRLGEFERLAIARDHFAIVGAHHALEQPVGCARAGDPGREAFGVGLVFDGEGVGLEFFPGGRRCIGVEPGITEQVGIVKQHRGREGIGQSIGLAVQHAQLGAIGMHAGQMRADFVGRGNVLQRLGAEIVHREVEVRKHRLHQVHRLAGGEVGLNATGIGAGIAYAGDRDIGIGRHELVDELLCGVRADAGRGQVVIVEGDGYRLVDAGRHGLSRHRQGGGKGQQAGQERGAKHDGTFSFAGVIRRLRRWCRLRISSGSRPCRRSGSRRSRGAWPAAVRR